MMKPQNPIFFIILSLQLASVCLCIFLNKQNHGPGLPSLEAGSGLGETFNASFAAMSFPRDPFSNAASAFSERDVCFNGVTQCNGYVCDECESCCGVYNPTLPCNSFPFGVCCTHGDSCVTGSVCWYQLSGPGQGCCPPGMAGCFTTPFTCCYPGSTCGASGCIGNPSTSVPYYYITYTSTVSRFMTNTITVTSPSVAASTVNVTTTITSLSTAVYTVTSTTTVPQVKARRDILEVIKGQLEKYALAPRAIPVSTWTGTSYLWVSIWTTVTSTSTFLSGQGAVRTNTYTSSVVNLVSSASTFVVTITTVGSSNPTQTSITATPISSIAPGVTGGVLPQSGSQSVVTVTASTTSTAAPIASPNKSLSTGAKAGIGAGVGVSALASLGFLILFLLGRRRLNSEGRNPDLTTAGENTEYPSPQMQKPELPSPGPFMGPMPEKPHREVDSNLPGVQNAAVPVMHQYQEASPSSPSSTTFPEMASVSSTQGRSEVSSQPMGFQAVVGSDYEYYELQGTQPEHIRAEMRG